MSGLFPALLPDELFYSAAARFQELMQFRSVSAVRMSMFGSIDVTAVVDLPSRLQQFLDRLPAGHPYTAGELIRKHTLFPYYEPFVTSSRAHAAFAAMRDGASRGIHRLLNVTGTGVAAPAHLRYCMKCVGEQNAGFGIAYWRRLHQVPGIVVCPDHQEPLRQSSIERRARVDRAGYQALSESVSKTGSVLRVPDRDVERHAGIAREVEWLLTADGCTADLPALRMGYRRMAREAGWMDSANRVMTRALERALFDSYGSEFFKVAGIRLSRTGSGDTWISRIFQLPIFFQIPMRHLVVLGFFGARACELLSGSQEEPYTEEIVAEEIKVNAPSIRGVAQPVAAGPCRNTVCSSFDPQGLRNLTAVPDGPRQLSVRCSDCGFSYWYDSNCSRIWGVVETGDRWDQELRRLVLETSKTQAAIAKILGVNSSLLLRLAWEKGITRPSWSTRKWSLSRRTGERGVDPERRTKHRASMSQLVHQHTGAARTELRSLNPTAYAWLERHDSGWLESVLPARRAPGGSREEYWLLKDERLVSRVREAVAKLRNKDGRPRRITVGVIAAELGMGGLCAQLPRLPQTRQMVELSLESDEAYALRRIRWAASQFVHELMFPSTPYVLAKRAGMATIATANRVCDLAAEYERACAAVREAASNAGIDAGVAH